MKTNDMAYIAKIVNIIFERQEVSDQVIDAVSDKIYEINDMTEECPNCGSVFLVSEGAMQYEQSNGDYTCDCLSPENQAADKADMEIKQSKEDK